MARFGQGLFSGSSGTGLNMMNAQLAQVGENLGAAVPTARRVMQERQDETQFRQLMSQAQQALASKDSSALATIAANLSQIGKQEQAMALSQAAQKISGESEASARSRGVQGGLAYFTQAAARGIPFEQLQEGIKSVIGLDGSAQEAFEAYQRGLPETKDNKTYNLPKGSVLTDAQGNVLFSNVQEDVPERKLILDAQELAKTGKYTAESVQRAGIAQDFSLLVPKVDQDRPDIVGDVPAAVENRIIELNGAAAEKSVLLGRNLQLQQELLSSPEKTTGILSNLRTTALDFAGLRDEEEEVKTSFLRTRNSDIVNGLPPGVASDRDIMIFSQGFPKENSSSEEILRYLKGEQKALAAYADMALIADRHIASQVGQGRKASMVGYEDKRQQYSNLMNEALRDIESARSSGNAELEQFIIQQVAKNLGFTPRIFR